MVVSSSVASNSELRRKERTVSRGTPVSPNRAASPTSSSPSLRSSADSSRRRTAPPPAQMAPQPPPGDRTSRGPQASSPTSVPASNSRSYIHQCVMLVDWWLERMADKICIVGHIETPQIKKEGFASEGTKKASRMFKCAIKKRWDYSTVVTENDYVVCVKGIMNYSRMQENGFSEKVCKCFEGGFPKDWKDMLDSSMEHIDEHSEPSLNPEHSASEQYYHEKFNSDSFVKKGYRFAEPNFSAFRNMESSDLGEPGTQKCCKTSANLDTDNASELPAAGMTPQSGVVQASEKNEVRTLRSGRVFGRPIGAPITDGNKRKRTRHKASSDNKLSNKAASLTADLTS